ncbi:hypothetical protein NLM33_49010 (plasmid) [Bradyrhizobium sp. CCGUVB1N3]|uniref:hypothetical protein n=1 Tax=Bradyrhizobium sp. CCGUVB1N3 TaxID=2949629 RepID=UPI0020B2DB96|nr:hypothetical protein [Bradyrhizobium sp. CCGUVB1N3]MCP3478004.1 hypothetical protein [Bradyrhizobium sp. CCGUVB1N3]
MSDMLLIRREAMKFNPLEDMVMDDEAPSIWDGPHVGKRLSEAMQTLRLLPMPGVCGYPSRPFRIFGRQHEGRS